jgi:hypothetical protein
MNTVHGQLAIACHSAECAVGDTYIITRTAAATAAASLTPHESL